MSERVTNWWEALCALIEANRDRPHEWGSWDCCQFAAEAVLTMTGDDFRSAFPAYTDESGADAVIASFGSVENMLTSVLGASKPVARAFRGDILAIDNSGRTSAAVCLGVACVSVGFNGLVFLKSSDASAAWTIG